MRINIYTEELIDDVTITKYEIVIAEYVSSRTGAKMKNYGLRIFLKYHPDLHYIPGRDDDDDRSAVTFWCGSSLSRVRAFAADIKTFLDKVT